MPKTVSISKPGGTKSPANSSSKPSHAHVVEQAALVGLKATARVLQKLDVPAVFHRHLKAAISELNKHVRSRRPGDKK